MQEVEDLGREIESAWSATHYRTEAFAAIAQAALATRALPASLSTERIFRWVLSSPQIPHQPSNASFGEPPIQLYAGRRFYIEALFWTEGTTAIHQHSFSGAFQVLVGSSIHTPYTFEREEVIARELLLGRLVAGQSELLQVGDIRQIASDDRLIHSLFHLDRPSVTLVVRTKHDAGSGPQYSYLHPGIAHDPFVPDDRSPRLLRLLDVLDHRAPETAQLLLDIAGSADLGSVVVMLMQWFRKRPVDPAAADALLDTVARRHRALAASLRIAVLEARRQALVIHRRRSNHDRAHRFLYALLLNVGNRAQILRFVEQAYPGADPIERVVGWVKELLTARAADGPPVNPADLVEYDLGEVEIQVLCDLLRQRTPAQILAALQEEYDFAEGQKAQILDLCESLTGSALFQPLFRM